jgi:hypothetical protein
MSVPTRAETSLLSHDELELVRQSHHPAVYNLSVDELRTVQKRVRDLRDKERTLAWQKRREVRGKAESPRGSSFPGTAEHSLKRKQVFAAAVQRVNSETHRVQKLLARNTLSLNARRALALRKAGETVRHPDAGRSAGPGMTNTASQKRRTKVNPAKVGSVSQATKRSQATRDNRG